MREIIEEMAPNAPGLTAKEWARALGRSRAWTTEQIGALITAGRMRHGKRAGTDIAGRPRVDYVYSFVNS